MIQSSYRLIVTLENHTTGLTHTYYHLTQAEANRLVTVCSDIAAQGVDYRITVKAA